MKAEPIIIDNINANLKVQLTVINQSFLHARIVRHWGLDILNSQMYGVSISAMKTTDKLIDRILFLEGMPNLQAIGKLFVGEDVEDIINCEMRLMNISRNQLAESIRVLEEHRDYESRALLSPLLNDTEEYIDWLETQQWLLEELGMANYIQSQIGEIGQ